MCFVAPLVAAAGSAFPGLGAALSSFGGLGTAASAASGLVGAYSSIRNANAANAAAQATAKQQEQAALDSLRQGEDESDKARRAGASMMAQQRVAQAANGIDVSAPSALEVLDDTKRGVEQDAWAIRKNANNAATGYMQQAANTRQEGRNALSQGRWGSAGTLLTTAATVGDKYSQWARRRAYPAAAAAGGYT